jgi:hypothetical protein
MGPGESTTNHIPGAAADRRETIAISDNSPGSGRLGAGGDAADANFIQPRTGLRQAFPSLIPARPYCADVLGDGLRIREKNWPSSVGTFS